MKGKRLLLHAGAALALFIPNAYARPTVPPCCDTAANVALRLDGRKIDACPEASALRPGRHTLEIATTPGAKAYYQAAMTVEVPRRATAAVRLELARQHAEQCRFHVATAAQGDSVQRPVEGADGPPLRLARALYEASAQERQHREDRTQRVLAATLDAIERDMTVVTGGCFLMGDAIAGGYAREQPVHEVCVKDFGLARFPVTRKLWNAVMDTPAASDDCGDDCPVEPVSWNDAQAFIGRLNSLAGRNYRLPSEAEWEYAAREGSNAPRAWGNEIGDGPRRWNKERKTPVGSYKPNRFGIYDMLGNVFQWTEDCWHADYRGAPTDGSAWSAAACAKYALRGGSWHYYPHHVRAALRYGLGADYRGNLIGFRLARALP